MLRATRREMEKSHRIHRTSSNAGSSASQKLLLVYAVECGLKALLMHEHRVDTYSDLPEAAKINHDLREALKQLRAPASMRVRTVTTRHQRNPQETVHPNELHQTFRYGIPIADETDVIADLNSVAEWIKERLG